MAEAPSDPVGETRAELSLSDEDIARLVASTDVRVEAYSLSGDSAFHDHWVAVIEHLDLMHRDLGLDAALIGLAHKVRERVRDLLTGMSAERESLLPLLVKLRLADRNGSLGAMLQRSTILIRPGPHEPGD